MEKESNLRFIFIRHGEPDGMNYGGKLLGSDGKPKKRLPKELQVLSQVGIRQAGAAGCYLRRYQPQYIFSSDAIRAHQTAIEINKQLDEPLEIVLDERLREQHVREQFELDIEKENDAERKANLTNRLEQCIPFEQVFMEAKAFIREIEKRNFNGNIVFVTHGMIMSVFQYCALYDSPDIKRYKEQKTAVEDDLDFCAMFSVDLKLPLAQREIIFPCHEIKQKILAGLVEDNM